MIEFNVYININELYVSLHYKKLLVCVLIAELAGRNDKF